MKKTFTLIEILISLVIIGILTVILFKVYVTIGNLNIRIENEKNLQNEIMYLNQFLIQILDKYQIDYSKYTNLKSTNWITSWLNLIWENWKIFIYQTWDCDISDWKQIRNKNCWIEANINWKNYSLTNTGKVFVNNLIFKIIPFTWWITDLSGTYQKWIWIQATFYIKNYNPKYRPFNVKINFENFYNIRKY